MASVAGSSKYLAVALVTVSALAQGGEDVGRGVVVAPDGSRVFVTGISEDASTGYDWATVSYDAVDYSVTWAMRLNGPGNTSDSAYPIAINSGGTRVFVGGSLAATATNTDFAVAAYYASNGTMVWQTTYDGPGHARDVVYGTAVSPDGSLLFAVGAVTTGGSSGQDAYVAAYQTGNGDQSWNYTFNGPASLDDNAEKVVVKEEKLYVAGRASRSTSGKDIFVQALNASTGSVLWSQPTYFGGSANADDQPWGLLTNPGGSLIFVSGYVRSSGSGKDFATLAMRSTGAIEWSNVVDGPD